MKLKSPFWLLLAVAAHASPARANAWYASPLGSASGDGSILHPWNLATALADNTSPASKNHVVKPGETIWLRGGTYYGVTNGDSFISFLAGTSNSPIIVRAYRNERPIIECTTTNTTGLYVAGRWTCFWGIEVWNSSSNRWAVRNPGLMVFGPGTKLINLIIHDVGTGIGCWEQATNSEIYGCLIYNNGCEYASGEGQYHGIYSHSSGPGHSFRDNIVFNGFGFGFHCYSDRGEPLSGYHIEGNVSFNNGILNTNGGYLHEPNFLLGGYTPVRNLVFRNNYGYYSAGYGDNLLLGYQTYENDNAIVCSNYFAGGRVTVSHWTNLTLINNTFAHFTTTSKYRPSASVGTYLWDTNHYYSFGGWTMPGTDYLPFSKWQAATAFDPHSTSHTTVLTNAVVFVRPNAYEPGRGNIIVYNWGLSNTVSVDVSSVLSQGESYEVRNAQSFFGSALLSGRYDGSLLQLPMTNLTAATPVGFGSPPPPTGPGFNVFILLTQTKVALPPP